MYAELPNEELGDFVWSPGLYLAAKQRVKDTVFSGPAEEFYINSEYNSFEGGLYDLVSPYGEAGAWLFEIQFRNPEFAYNTDSMTVLSLIDDADFNNRYREILFSAIVESSEQDAHIAIGIAYDQDIYDEGCQCYNGVFSILIGANFVSNIDLSDCPSSIPSSYEGSTAEIQIINDSKANLIYKGLVSALSFLVLTNFL